MSRTHHVRPRRTRSEPTTSAKKPDDGRRWVKRNILSNTPAPRDVREHARGSWDGWDAEEIARELGLWPE